MKRFNLTRLFADFVNLISQFGTGTKETFSQNNLISTDVNQIFPFYYHECFIWNKLFTSHSRSPSYITLAWFWLFSSHMFTCNSTLMEWSRVSVQGVKSLGSHFACLCRGSEFYEVIKKKLSLFFKKKMAILLHFSFL